MNNNKEITLTTKLTLCALFVAITATLSQISIPIGLVPINLATLSVLCAGILLGSKWGMLSQLIYVLIGAIGFPVFANFRGGLSALFGSTGGYLLGYIIAAYVIGLVNEFFNKENSFHLLVISFIAGFLTYISLGSVWFMIISGMDLWKTLMICVFPFLIGDTIKILIAVIICKRLSPYLKK